MPFDIVVSRFFPDIFPEITDKPIDILLADRYKIIIYEAARESLIKNCMVSVKKPIFLMQRKIPYFIYEHLIPEWNMSLEEINHIVVNCHPTAEDGYHLFSNLISDFFDEIQIFIEGNVQTIPMKQINIDFLLGLSQKDIAVSISINIHKYLSVARSFWKEIISKSHVLEISDNEEMKQVAINLKSTTNLEILKMANGTKNISAIARSLKKHTPNISANISAMKKIGLIQINSDGKVERTIKRVIVDFDEILYK
ncbi:MAG: hypothetical protein ACLFNK_04535 [Candidatus Woesearchaeota archaeon]